MNENTTTTQSVVRPNNFRIRDVILHNVLLIAKPFPIIYSVLLSVMSVCDITTSEKWNLALELVFFASLPFTAICLLLAWALKLCKWYRLQCILMLAPIAIPLYRIFSPDTNIVGLRWVISIALLLCTLKCSYLFLGTHPKRTCRKLINRLIKHIK